MENNYFFGELSEEEIKEYFEKIGVKIEELTQEELKEYIEKIDNKIDELVQEELKELIEKLLTGNTELIPKVLGKVYELSKVNQWLIFSIKRIKHLIENDDDLKEAYYEEYVELNILNSIFNCLIKSPNNLSEELYNVILPLCNLSKGKERINSILKFLLKTEGNLEYYIFVYNLIKHNSTLFEKQYIVKIANIFYRHDNFKLALELFQIAANRTKGQKELSALYNDIGCCYIDLPDVEGAIQSFKKSIENDKQNASAHNNLAYTLAVECDTIEKDEKWERKLNEALKQIAIAVGSDDVSHYINKVKIEYELGKYSETIDDCNKGCKLFKNYSSCKTLIQMRILARLEQFENEIKSNRNTLEDVFNDLETIFLNEKEDDKYFYHGLRVYKKLDGLNGEKIKRVPFLLFLLEFNILLSKIPIL